MSNGETPVKNVVFLGVPEMESFRKTLLNQYHSQIVTHAGYIIAIVVGALTLVSRWDSFILKDNILGILLFYLLISSIIGLLIYFAGRISYWNAITNQILILTVKQLIDYAKIKKSNPESHFPLSDEEQKTQIPCIALMQMCAGENVKKNKTLNPLRILAKLSSSTLLAVSLLITILCYAILLTFSVLMHLF